MKDQDYPALYRSADDLSLSSQRHFFNTLKVHLILLILGASLSVAPTVHWAIPALQLAVLLGALSCSIYLFSKRPDRYWYAGRAVAESIKTSTWRYVCRAEPFHTDDTTSKNAFHQKLRSIVEQNREIVQTLTEHLDEPQITDAMRQIRATSLEVRKAKYADERIKEQLTWYAKKTAHNRRASKIFFWILIGTNVIAVSCAILRMRFADAMYWPTDIFIAVSAGLLSWMQAKRFSELASSYALAAHEIGLIREQSTQPKTEAELSAFIGDAENAFSREHTQWTARKDA